MEIPRLIACLWNPLFGTFTRDPHFGQPAVEAFSRGGALGPVNIALNNTALKYTVDEPS